MDTLTASIRNILGAEKTAKRNELRKEQSYFWDAHKQGLMSLTDYFKEADRIDEEINNLYLNK